MIIQIRLPNGRAAINLQAVVESVGAKNKGEVRSYSIPKYRKLCKLILQYGSEETFGDTDAFLNKCSNKKAKEVWNSEKQRSALARR